MVLLSYFSVTVTLLTIYTADANERMRAAQASTVWIPCVEVHRKEGDVFVFNWRKEGISRRLYHYRTDEKNILQGESRVNVTLNSTRLRLSNVTFRDSGIYTCYASQVIPPPTILLENYTLELIVEGVSIGVCNKSKLDCTCLHCKPEGLTEAGFQFTWTRGGVLVGNDSSLKLCKPNWCEGDVFSCQAIQGDKYFNESYTVPTGDRAPKYIYPLLIFIVAPVAVICLIIIVVVTSCCICRRRADGHDRQMYNNVVYENFTYSNNSPETAPPQKTDEECVYEN